MVEALPRRDGYYWIECEKWRLVTAPEKRCRMPRCERLAVAELNRGIRSYRPDGRVFVHDSWWAYCLDHLYGRRIWNGKIFQEVRADSPAGRRAAALPDPWASRAPR